VSSSIAPKNKEIHKWEVLVLANPMLIFVLYLEKMLLFNVIICIKSKQMVLTINKL